MNDPDSNPTNPSFSQAETQASDHSNLRHHATLPATIGKYRIESLIGQGGMGAVYKAEQESPRRTVALKVIKAGVASKSLLLRFEIESQILGKLDHPGIATIFEAGTFDEGQGQQPFFAMEFVQGQEFLDYVNSKKLSTRERLALLAKIADAVQHAHQKGIIHRDLKPGNILVNNEGQIKVLDFGVARATDADIQTATMHTDMGQLIGTVPYMSPEQASGNPDDLDTRSDVYALGVIAYELLTGQMPYDLKQKMIHEAVRVIREDEPKTLSTINKTFRGDVEIIVSKALIKEKERRYQSASELGSDIERYLNNEPIEARPPSTWYQLSKFAKRNKGLVAGLTLAFVLLSAGLMGTGYGLIQANEQRALAQSETGRANEEAQRATTMLSERDAALEKEKERAAQLQQVAEFQSNQLTVINAEQMGNRLRSSIINAAALDSRSEIEKHLADINFTNIGLGSMKINVFEPALSTIETKFGDQPLVQAQLFQSLADTMRELGILELAQSSQERALSIRQAELGDKHLSTLISMNNQGALYLALGKSSEAELCFREVLGARRTIFGNGHPETLNAINNLAALLKLSGYLDEAKSLFLEALEVSRQVHGSEHQVTFRSINNLGNVLESQGMLEDAERYYNEGLTLSRKIYGDDHPNTLTVIGNMATLLQNQGKLSEAESFQIEALKSQRRVLGDEHPNTIISINNLAALLEAQGKLQDAETYYHEAIETCRRVLGVEHPFTIVMIHNMGLLLKSQGRLDDAVPYYREELDIRLRLHGGGHPDSIKSMHALAILLELGNRWSESEELWRLQLGVARTEQADGGARLGSVLIRFGMNLIEQDRYADAQIMLEECLEIRRRLMPEGHWLIWNTQSLLGHTLTKQAKFVQAEGLLVEAAEQIDPPEQWRSLRRGEAIQRVVDLYTVWHASKPNSGYDLKAEEWGGRLEELE